MGPLLNSIISAKMPSSGSGAVGGSPRSSEYARCRLATRRSRSSSLADSPRSVFLAASMGRDAGGVSVLGHVPDEPQVVEHAVQRLGSADGAVAGDEDPHGRLPVADVLAGMGPGCLPAVETRVTRMM
jgi:hypothetical protein